jgi:hypothetical protein
MQRLHLMLSMHSTYDFARAGEPQHIELGDD